MNFTTAEAAAAVEAFVKLVDAMKNVDVVICPTYLSIWRVRDILKQTHIQLGAQDVFWAESGAFTGQISPKMLYDACVSFCIVGHSETRGRFGKLETPEASLGYFGETDFTVNLKIKALLYHAINPILCVGEDLAEREAGETDSVIAKQLEGALNGFEEAELYSTVIAYEPVWAIGTGKTCDTAEANRVCGSIRAWVEGKFGPDLADTIRVLYGGSVKASNAGELFAQEHIDGGLVGGASLVPEEFSRIVMSA